MISGGYYLPPSYELRIVHPQARLEFAKSDDDRLAAQYLNQEHEARAKANYTQPITLASAYNVLKIFVSFIQARWATTTLYRARGDQIDEYGYVDSA